jgi:hypothetical protein
MIKRMLFLVAVLAISIYSDDNKKNKFEFGGFGMLTTGYGKLDGVIILRPVFRYYTNSWFFVSPVYNLKIVRIYDDEEYFDNTGILSYAMQYTGMSIGATIKPFKYFGVSLASGALLQHYSEKSNNNSSWNHFALSADISLKYYIRENLALGIMYYLAFDVFNESENPDGGLTLGFTCFL